MDEKIKVHVTEEQREHLEFLVNRRIGDLHFLITRGGGGMTGSERVELTILDALKRELQHAGT